MLGVTLLWASHAWYLVAILSQVTLLPFFVLARGLGLIQFPDVFVLISPSADALVIIVLGFVLLAAHSFLPDHLGRWRYISHALTVLWSIGLYGATFVDPRYLFLVSASFVAVIADDSLRFAALMGMKSRAVFSWLAVWMFLEIAVVAVLGAEEWVAAGFGGAYPLSSQGLSFAVAGLRILGLAFPVLPELVVLFLFSWLLRPFLKGRMKLPPWANEASGTSQRSLNSSPKRPGNWPRLMLAGGAALSAFVGAYPYLPAVNSASILVGRDVATSYGCWLNAVPCTYSGFSLDNQRLGALWLLQGISAVTGSASFALKLAPALWGVFLVVATYLFVREGTGDGQLAGISALLTSVSLASVTGLVAGILANWLGLPIAFLFFAFVLKALRKRRLVFLVPSFALSLALLLVHPWTWVLIMAVLALYLGAELVQGWVDGSLAKMRLETGVLGVMLALGVAADAVKGFTASGSALKLGFQAIFPLMRLSNVPSVISNLKLDLIPFVGGAETNPLWFILGTVGVLSIPSLRGRFGKLLVAWLAVVSVVLPFVTPSEGLTMARLVFDLPVNVLAAIGLLGVSRTISLGLAGSESWESWSRHAPLITLAATVGLSLGFALEYVGFLFT
jgi:hypothetical protein